MKKITDRKLIRDYLLGRLNEQSEMDDNLSESIFMDDELAEVVAVAKRVEVGVFLQVGDVGGVLEEAGRPGATEQGERLEGAGFGELRQFEVDKFLVAPACAKLHRKGNLY